MTENFDNLQYNSCVSRGICSINPRTSAMQNVLGLYLHLCAKYCLKLLEKNVLNNNVKKTILNTTAISISNPEFNEDCYMEAITCLKKILSEVIEIYNNTFNQTDFKGENIFNSDIFKKCESVLDTIKLGETIFRENVSKIPTKKRDMFKIMLITAKSISINILDLESYGCENNTAFSMLLNLINSINSEDFEDDKLKTLIYDAAKCNTSLMTELHQIQEERYGKQGIYKVSYTTKPSKAILVVGSNIKELENVLESTKNEKIDIYTHDEMMLAHTFPKFKEYSNLKGQYGYGVENCLIDFATFPGPIILTKHSLHNIENLYRGRLFTTDVNFFKGVIKIENNNFKPVIASAKESKGFKRGKKCETVDVGYDYDKCIESIETAIKENHYKKIVVIGLKDFSYNDNEYFENLTSILNSDTLIISFSYNFERKNLIHLNTCFDSFAVVRVFQAILKYNLPTSIFLPKCRRNTIAEILNFSRYKNVNVYIGDCEPVLINPSLINTLQEIFGLKTLNSARKDAEFINNL